MSSSEWREVKLGDLVDSISQRHKFDKEKIVLVNTSDVIEGVVLNHQYVKNENLKGQFKKSFRKNDILYSEIRPKNKRFAYVNFDSEDYVASTKLMVLRKKDENITSEFLYQILKSEDLINALQAIAESRSGTFPQITYNELSRTIVSLPPLPEQKAIAHILSTLDEKIEVNNQINKTLENIAQTIFKQWFVDFEFPNGAKEPYKSSGGEMVESELGMIPKGWEIVQLQDLANITMGLSPKSESYNTDFIGTPLLNGAADFSDGLIKALKYTTKPTRLCKKNDLVFCIRATIGNITFADKEYCLGRGVAAITPKNESYIGLIYYNLKLAMDKLKANATGSVILGLSKPDISNLKIILSGSETISKYSDISKAILDKKHLIQFENKKLKELRDSLLPKLMSGEIRVPIEEN